jgi:hypothetical protein
MLRVKNLIPEGPYKEQIFHDIFTYCEEPSEEVTDEAILKVIDNEMEPVRRNLKNSIIVSRHCNAPGCRNCCYRCKPVLNDLEKLCKEKGLWIDMKK